MFYSKYIAHLEAELLKQETFLKNICAEKERQINRLVEENRRLQARNDRLELMLIPVAREHKPAKQPDVPIHEERDWQAYLNRHIQEEFKEKPNVSDQKGNGVHQPAGDAAKPEDGRARARSEVGFAEASSKQWRA